MIVEHYSEKEILRLQTRAYSPDRIRDMASIGKPVGFWVSVPGEHDWPSWCEAESFGIGPHRHIFELEMSKVLHVASLDEIDRFDWNYRLPTPAGRYDFGLIDWQRVARGFKGIVISPYQWQRRLGSTCRWYYSWDCASGCIWDVSVLKPITPSPRTPRQAEAESLSRR